MLTADPVSYPHTASFEPGHATTIEPGYYNEGKWGMRIESALLCRTVDVRHLLPTGYRSLTLQVPNTPEGTFLGWERLTQVGDAQPHTAGIDYRSPFKHPSWTGPSCQRTRSVGSTSITHLSNPHSFLSCKRIKTKTRAIGSKEPASHIGSGRGLDTCRR